MWQKMTSTDSYNSICVSGLPLSWSEYNGTYVRDGERNGYPKYVLPARACLGLPIPPMKIVYIEGWILCTDDELSIITRGPRYSTTPFGQWNNCFVSPHESFGTFWNSNGEY